MRVTDNFYGNASSEIDLRAEIDSFFDGSDSEIPKATSGILRRMNRDANNNLIDCPCSKNVTHEGDKDYFCPICFGERHLWKETLIEYYQVSAQDSGHGSKGVWNETKQFGLVNIPLSIFYLKYNIKLDTRDKIISIVLDTEGNILTPIKRELVWRINEISVLRSDYGRIEFIKIFCNNEDVKYLQAPKIK